MRTSSVRPLVAAALVAVSVLLGATAPASATNTRRVDNTLCQVEDGVTICQTVTGTYSLSTTPSGRWILTVHLVQEEYIYAETTYYASLEIDEQYVYRNGEPVVVVSSRLQQIEQDGDLTSCTDFGRLVFANGQVRFEPTTTDCT